MPFETSAYKLYQSLLDIKTKIIELKYVSQTSKKIKYKEKILPFLDEIIK